MEATIQELKENSERQETIQLTDNLSNLEIVQVTFLLY